MIHALVFLLISISVTELWLASNLGPQPDLRPIKKEVFQRGKTLHCKNPKASIKWIKPALPLLSEGSYEIILYANLSFPVDDPLSIPLEFSGETIHPNNFSIVTKNLNFDTGSRVSQPVRIKIKNDLYLNRIEELTLRTLSDSDLAPLTLKFESSKEPPVVSSIQQELQPLNAEINLQINFNHEFSSHFPTLISTEVTGQDSNKDRVFLILNPKESLIDLSLPIPQIRSQEAQDTRVKISARSQELWCGLAEKK